MSKPNDTKPSRGYWYVNYMSMSGTLNEAKEFTPRAEHVDIREYVLASDYENLQARLDVALKALDIVSTCGRCEGCETLTLQILSDIAKIKNNA